MADDGAGIPPEILPHVFERFARADDSRAHSAAHSTGLGLAIVKKIIDEHGGSVAITNVLPNGVRVIIELPAALTPDSPRSDSETGLDV